MLAQAQDTHTLVIPRPASEEIPPRRALTPQERGRLGGQATFARYGRAHLYVICNPSACCTPDPLEGRRAGMGDDRRATAAA